MIKSVCDACKEVALCDVDEDGVAMCDDCISIAVCICCERSPCLCPPGELKGN
jgi:hypothetical protein